ncbi:nucleotidyltransferase domain-containing protein [uncultured Chitinophaga sp.]|uniref:nucleotidyltransferase domain-containing protein n=1 Tax=uncultured Chitinophaga sp. TaxID=339340 RepID=UPI0025F2CA38|nr:nucleotidyltransferase domain-containing protein [uncultured Chitinophaga sp.]
MELTIIEKLLETAVHEKVKVLYACESGSRAWGFASTDSDYDVRFIYTRRTSDYLSIADRRDVIELPVNEVLDIGGWDLRKALQLFLKSNAPLYEWLQSPVWYDGNHAFVDELKALMPKYFSCRAGCHHYLSMAFNTLENDLQGGQVKIKKYFYALRPALAALWIIEKQEVPPMEFGILRTLVQDEPWQQAVDTLLKVKAGADEKALITPIPLLQNWLQETLNNCKEKASALPSIRHTTEELDELFRKYMHHDL